MKRFVILVTALAAVPLRGQGEREKTASLSPADMAKLGEQKVLVTNETFRQSFEPYINSALPVFITSDAVLNAYHVLLEESVARLEARQVRVLAELLKHLWKRLPKSAAEVTGNDRLRDAAKRRATLVLAVAMQLLGEPAPGLAKDLAPLVKTEVGKIESATGTDKPLWLGAPHDGFMAIDYTRFAPRGFYMRSLALQRYFRSVVWLQAIPFRVANEEDLLAALLIGSALVGTEGSWKLPPAFETFYGAWHGFIGGGDDLDLASIAYEAHDPEAFAPGSKDNGLGHVAAEMVREARDLGRGLVNDHIAAAPSDTQIMQQLQIRILPAARLRDAVLFQRTTDIRTVPDRKYPSGMEVAAALGSALAGDWLKAHAPAAVAETVFNSRGQWKGGKPNPHQPPPLYDEYLQCLAALVDAPEKDAPDFMRGEAWQRKSCGTLLAGWAQMRRIWVLQAKTSVHFGAAAEVEPGFVESDPDFFQRLGELSGRTLELLAESKALESNSEAEALADLELTRDAFRRWASDPGEEENMFATERAPLVRGCDRLRALGLPAKLADYPPEAPEERTDQDPDKLEKIRAHHKEQTGKWYRAVADFADKVMRDLTAARDSQRDALLQRLAVDDEGSLQGRWMGFNRMVSRIESLAHKQLRQLPFTERDREFIRNFGFTLAKAMFYDGNSYVSPRDDAMKIVDVFSGPAGYLHAAAGRPHAIYVLYPWQGKEVQCIGSVLPWHEFNDPSRLNDEAWRRKLDGPEEQRPKVPDWYAPLLGEQGMWK